MERKRISEENMSEIMKIIQEKFSSQTDNDIREAFSLCSRHGIDPKQFELYYRPNELNEDFDLSNLVNLNVSEKDSETASELSDIAEIPERIYADCFPFDKGQLFSLSTKSIHNIINGCLLSYASKNIIKVLNPSEFLGKMASVVDLKKQTDYLTKTRNSLYQEKVSINTVFDEFIKYLDTQAYTKNNWGAKSVYFSTLYPTLRNNQKERISDIPIDDKRHFIISIFEKSMDSFNPNTTKNNYALLKSDKKEDAVEFLWYQLQLKWHDKDVYN
jgi:hypothetical protein